MFSSCCNLPGELYVLHYPLVLLVEAFSRWGGAGCLFFVLGFDSVIAVCQGFAVECIKHFWLLDFSLSCRFPLEEVTIFGCCLMKFRRWVGAMRFFGCNEIFWLHHSVEFLRVQRALSPNREQPEQMQVESEDCPRQHISSFWSNSAIEKKIMLEAAGLFSVCVCVHLAKDPSCDHISLMEICSFSCVLVFIWCWYIRVRKWKGNF